MEWVRRASEYQTLVGKRDRLGCTLLPIDASRLRELERFFAAEGRSGRAEFEGREQCRVALSVVVEFDAPRGARPGEVRNLSGLGMWIETDAPLSIGARTVVRIEDEGGEAWRFAAEVVRKQPCGMGVKFVGIPLVLRLGHRPARRQPTRHAA
jgi:hypothetical protein